MRRFVQHIEWKYFLVEATFFVVFFCLFPVLSNFEYNFIELRKSTVLGAEAISSLYYGVFNVLTALIFYKIVQRFLFKKQFVLFALAVVAYLVLFHFYRSGLYYVTVHNNLLPESLRSESSRWYNAHSRVNFSLTYMCMEFLCIIALAYFIRSIKQDAEMKTLKEQQLITELNYLKTQLHPHFFFNTINNIYALSLKQSTDTAPMVARLGDMMRYILYEANQEKVKLSREINFLNDYIAVEKIRHKHNHIKFDVQGAPEGLDITPLLLLPFIENAFKHGLEQEIEMGYVNIILCINEDELILDVANSKPAGKRLSENGIGLQNVFKRLNILYPSRHQLTVTDDADRHHVSLILQVP